MPSCTSFVQNSQPNFCLLEQVVCIHPPMSIVYCSAMFDRLFNNPNSCVQPSHLPAKLLSPMQAVSTDAHAVCGPPGILANNQLLLLLLAIVSRGLLVLRPS
jgi:hypothetical protein